MGTKISHLLPANRMVYTNKEQTQGFEVGALSVSQLALMFSLHKDAMESLMAVAQGGGKGWSNFVARFPVVATSLIAMAAGVDEPEEVAAVGKFGAGIQVVALAEIWEVTVPDPKRLTEIIESVNLSLRAPAKSEPSAITNSENSHPAKEPSTISKKQSQKQPDT